MSAFGVGPTPAAAHLPAPSVFLGALASEVNEPDELAAAFATVADVTERIVAAVRAGTLGEVAAAECLQSLRLSDEHGAVWAVGATSLRWYRKDIASRWKLAVPPANPDAAHQPSLDAALGALPASLLAQLGGEGALAGGNLGYGADPFEDSMLPAPKAWEYEPGDDRRLTYNG